jgi:hypothetical protein
MSLVRAALRRTAWALGLAFCSGFVHGCSLDLAALQQEQDAGMPGQGLAATRDKPDSGSLRAAPAAGQRDAAVMPPEVPEPACGVVGRPCCQPGNVCDFGACLRGLCSAYGGLYAQAEGCGPAVCAARNGYTAGCSCPSGFDAVAAWQQPYACADGSAGETGLVVCTTEVASASSWMGIWVQERSPLDCSDACLVPNSASLECSCPRGSDALSVRVEDSTTSCPGAGKTLTLCLDADDPRSNFHGAYALGSPGSARACVANPMTGACSCPMGSSAQKVSVGMEQVYFCSQ